MIQIVREFYVKDDSYAILVRKNIDIFKFSIGPQNKISL